MSNEYKIGADNIIRRKVGCKWNPACPNDWFQPLVEKLQDNGSLSPKEDLLYGQCILSLIEIVLNNVKFRFQTDEIKEDCKGEMLKDVLFGLPKSFDRTKGSTSYSYAFRICYTSGIHILEKWNKYNELFESLDENTQSNLDIDSEVL